MGTASRKTNQAKKKRREKRRERDQSGNAALPWKKYDVSAWFDFALPDAEDLPEKYARMESIYSLPQLEHGVYPDLVPAEDIPVFWGNFHPDARECLAVFLAVTLPPEDVYISLGAGQKEQYEALHNEMLADLTKLAEEGVVTACAVLGAWYYKGINVPRNRDQSLPYLLTASLHGDPYSSFLLAEAGEYPAQKLEAHIKNCAVLCPSGLARKAHQFANGAEQIEDGEAEEIARLLASFAGKKSWRCLEGLLAVLYSEHGARLRDIFAPSAVQMLQGMADKGFAPALEKTALVYSDGVLCSRRPELAKKYFLKAIEQGSAAARRNYACFLLREARTLPHPAQEQQTEEARSLLRENCRKGEDAAASSGALGCSLVLSDKEDEIKEGMRCLEDCAVRYSEFALPRKAVLNILQTKTAPEEFGCGVLLDEMIKKGDAESSCLKALLYLAGFMPKNSGQGIMDLLGFRTSAREQGMKMLEKAAKKGCGKAFCALAEMHLFGLFGCSANLEEALSFARQGEKAGSSEAKFWRMLIELGEFSPDADGLVGVNDAEYDTLEDDFEIVLSLKDDKSDVIKTMLWLQASDCSKKIPECSYVIQTASPRKDAESVSLDAMAFSLKCDLALLRCQAGTIAFFAHALRKIAKTPYAKVYANALSVMPGLPENAGCEDIADYLAAYLEKLPESHAAYLENTPPNKAFLL